MHRVLVCFVFLLFSILSGLSGVAQKHAFDSHIKGVWPGKSDGYVYLVNLLDMSADSVRIQSGKFQFKKILTEPTPFMLSAKKYPFYSTEIKVFRFFAGRGTTSITIDPAQIRHSTARGEKVTADFVTFQKREAPLDSAYNELIRNFSDTSEAGVKALRASGAKISAARKELTVQFIESHPASPVSPWVLGQIVSFNTQNPTQMDDLYNELAPSVTSLSYAKSIKAMLDKAKATAVGQMAPLFTQADTSGKPVSLKDFRGKYVLLDFWASWCTPCRAENPWVVKAFNEYKDKNFTILSVSLDGTGEKARKAWINAIRHDGLGGWTHVSDLKYWDNAVGILYAINAVPDNFLIDPSGKIVAKNLRKEALLDTLQKFLH